MASSSGNSSNSGIQNSGSEGDVQVLMEQRKRKRMQSNRESARRSRMRKQKHLDDLGLQVSQLKKENGEICAAINVATEHYLNFEAENCVLRAQVMELTQRLDSLNEILRFIDGGFHSDSQFDNGFVNIGSNFGYSYLNQPIMASPDLFQY